MYVYASMSTIVYRVHLGAWFFQIQDGKWMVSQLTTDYKGSDFTGSLTIGNPDIIKESGIISGIQNLYIQCNRGGNNVFPGDSSMLA